MSACLKKEIKNMEAFRLVSVCACLRAYALQNTISMGANTMDPDQTDMGLCCLQYRLSSKFKK